MGHVACMGKKKNAYRVVVEKDKIIKQMACCEK